MRKDTEEYNIGVMDMYGFEILQVREVLEPTSLLLRGKAWDAQLSWAENCT